MQRVFAAALALAFVGVVSAGPVSAQKASPEEVKICHETVKEMTGKEAKSITVNYKGKNVNVGKLCDDGNLNDAIEAAMSAGG